MALDPGKAQGEPARVMGTRLVVEGDLDHELWLDVNRVWVVGDRELAQLGGLPRQHLIRHALEGLPQHYEPAGRRGTRAEVQVAEPAGAPAMAHSAASTTRSSVTAGLILSQAPPRA